MIVLKGKVWKSKHSKYWLIEVPALDVMTQGKSRKDAFKMIKDAIEGVADDAFTVTVEPGYADSFKVKALDERALIALLLKRQRAAKGFSHQEMADLLKYKSRNAYAQYEHGGSVPSIEQLTKLLGALEVEEEVALAAG